MDSLRDMADRVADLAGISSKANTATGVLTSVITFALQREDPVCVVLHPPKVKRSESGPARLVAVTSTRLVEVQGTLPGDWWSSLFPRPPESLPTVTVRALQEFTRLEITGVSALWLNEQEVDAKDVLCGTSTTLSGSPSSEQCLLYDDVSATPEMDHRALLSALRFLTVTIGRTAEGDASS